MFPNKRDDNSLNLSNESPSENKFPGKEPWHPDREKMKLAYVVLEHSKLLANMQNTLEPEYKLGEYAGGILNSNNGFDNLIGETCIVELIEGITLVRRLEKSET